MTQGVSDLEFFESLPRTRGAATALLRDEEGRTLLVKPTYKPGWSLPGGVIEMGESPLAACRRECAEEIGFVPALSGLVCVDWLPRHSFPDGRPATIFVFAGAVSRDVLERVRLPAEELSAAVMATPAEVGRLLPEAMARRIGRCLQAATTLYLEDGREVSWEG
ncbi:NUDIX domain-containing protein [Marinactinospora thermotolerans]|uniref:ADP-ribose pyrophosphatase YjhB, NUDIX family n=1 Tax=Marinactinospora thermotolerans DSM 45154 TaxID=1122192 RepID=A0A1T4PUN8_9ACTN|nr:NUDIX hydrolase [Marinactinospora thermotolerans]SJZ95270.1 ADP-ribose pyrophosphatase YjhB, NUDIX family [Marinactinospora thermotolerans DSM 45154]